MVEEEVTAIPEDGAGTKPWEEQNPRAPGSAELGCQDECWGVPQSRGCHGAGAAASAETPAGGTALAVGGKAVHLGGKYTTSQNGISLALSASHPPLT